ncbi:valine--tRNA ligase [Telmatocola sphagniphila]|uniref:Valine--tRNA ligase n=1 Tax=Telmatocola sphagniphila TaxID=1123043 RepID=A0A8E6F020_9BACT|nr:valine--tRNA ligase [Telmatocola sphagniphila]QVL34328.1 valine--tRNA ligase [Telmatocola sphagniphila]
MSNEIAKAYDTKEAQGRCLQFWLEKGYFSADPKNPAEAYSIVIPPPNVTGALHLGHALNNTLQDILIRWRRMQGRNTLWIPGTDHAGIATQSVVEKRILTEEKKNRHDLGREELVKRIWQWKEQYEARITTQLKQLGSSADWNRQRFTLDPICAKAVRETFFNMFKDGYIYRGKRLVNWDTQLQTSVADDETYTEDTAGGFWTFRYPVVGSEESIRFSTTRPETMLGDSALCVHPSDERYQHLIGKRVSLPHSLGRTIPIIADGLLADPTLGTGCVKVTPAHDPNDYACWQRNPQIEIINILNPDGTINANGGNYAGQDRFKVREAIVKEMEELGFFEGREDRTIPLKFSDRSKTPIEPYLSDQWFVKMADREDGKPGLAQMALDAVTSGAVKFFPERYAKTYLDWLGEKRDWCISRQLWWGHRIPVWTKVISSSDMRYKLEHDEQWSDFFLAGEASEHLIAVQTSTEMYHVTGHRKSHQCFGEAIQTSEKEEVTWFIAPSPSQSDNPNFVSWLNSHGFTQDSDVLDTWFSSALWPHSTLGWPEETPEFKKYYPTSTLVTSRDIITLWVARMVLTGLYNTGKIPFRHVYVHPKMLDGFGETMSKSKGNGVDPLDIIDIYGTDALRFGMASLATETQDSRLPVSNICPNCGTSVPVKQEHMYMRTKKLNCPSCKQPFRPGGPWPDEDKELKTAKQGAERFELGRNFANKMWNAARFILMNIEPGFVPQKLDYAKLPIEDKWILSRLSTTSREITEHLESYRFSDVAKQIYEFTWSEFCDWYIEMAKGRTKGDSAESVQSVLVGVLDGILKLVHPVMPFVAESIWQELNQRVPNRGLESVAKAADSVMVASWPSYPASWSDAGLEKRFARMQELVRGVREIRNRYMIDTRTPLDTTVICAEEVASDFTALELFIKLLAGVGKLESGPGLTKPKQAATVLASDFETFVSLQGLIDPAGEVKRLEKQIVDKKKSLEGTRKKLSDEKFVSRAPAEIIEQQKALIVDLEKQIVSLEGMIQSFKE